MVVLLYSDTNYVLEGFSAEYSVTDCPLNCSSHGICVDNKCNCEDAYVGEACEWEACPDHCGFLKNRGSCEKISGAFRCVCRKGYLGVDCSLDVENSSGKSWHWMSHGTPQMKRTSHSGVYLSKLNRFYSFGGFNLNLPLGDLISFDLETSQWTTHNASEDIAESFEDDQPSPRYGHAMGGLLDGFVLFGGQLTNGSLSNELFYYDAQANRWHLLGKQQEFQPPPLTRHTLTVVNETWVYVFGGSLFNGEFSSRLFRFPVNTSGL